MDEKFRRNILRLLNQHRTTRIATVRPDGWPQVTTVGYANDGLVIYFLCGADSQKAANLARDDRVSLTVDDDPAQVMDIAGLSMAACEACDGSRRIRKSLAALDLAISEPERPRSPHAENIRGLRLSPDTHDRLAAGLLKGIWTYRPYRVLKSCDRCSLELYP